MLPESFFKKRELVFNNNILGPGKYFDHSGCFFNIEPLAVFIYRVDLAAVFSYLIDHFIGALSRDKGYYLYRFQPQHLVYDIAYVLEYIVPVKHRRQSGTDLLYCRIVVIGSFIEFLINKTLYSVPQWIKENGNDK